MHFLYLNTFILPGQMEAGAAGAPHIDRCGVFDAALLSPSA